MVKSVTGLYKHMKEGVLSLTNTLVDIDGDCELEKQPIICQKVHLKVILDKG